MIESKYTVEELAEVAVTFGTKKECVIAAFKVAGKTKATPSEARTIINKFLKKEVK
jgi:hypothetical protein